jgi:hypothetical protein
MIRWLVAARFLLLVLVEATTFWPLAVLAPPHLSATELACLILVLAANALVERLPHRR